MKDFIGLCPLLTSLKTFSVRSSTQNLSIRCWWLHVRGQSVQGLVKGMGQENYSNFVTGVGWEDGMPLSIKCSQCYLFHKAAK